ncbi:head-tail connector protein [Aquamicrobium zhengzhouense]|uniref:Phage gp6-like head-tail connector protein n=1 Tax=Aquamicrobium zhengzhouense TaxID=2781738 RepID=A0ABS0SGA5_9HYPH|nr:hypothetical protein [Aquamicrobium zhengzhouense]MBI1621497.1 hypothetical protein [Aquamicrobium zhengzhouense]
MHRPVLVTPPDILPVTVEDVKGYLPDTEMPDPVIEGMIQAAVDYLDGWTGILGRCLVEQTWRQDFDAFDRELRLPLGNVISVASVTWRDRQGAVHTVPDTSYSARTDAAGRASVRFEAGFGFPSNLHESAAVAVTYKAGFPTIPADGSDPAKSTVPQNAKLAIVLMVQNMMATAKSEDLRSFEVHDAYTKQYSSPELIQRCRTGAVDMLLSGLRVQSI